MRKRDFVRVSEYVWEVPTSYRADMRVPARLYASERLLEAALGDQSLEQLVNTATLPGLVRYALAMPDIHQGYGFPIGGVVASRTGDGVISPGGVGYDINCLHEHTNILHYFGYTRPIGEMAGDWSSARLSCQALTSGKETSTPVVQYLSRPPRSPVYRMTTEAGDRVIATADHPFWTPDGMVELGKLQPGDRVAVMPFEGTLYEPPGDEILLDEGDIERTLAAHGKGAAGNALGQIMAHLKRRELLPLSPSSPGFPYLLKIAGFVYGDGHIHFEGGSGKGVTWFYGEREDLEAIRRDVQALGFTPSRVYEREREHRITTPYDEYEFTQRETSFKVTSSTFAVLLATLGVPVGNKAKQDFHLPPYLFELPRWQQRLFLAAFFGAELAAPKAFDERNYNFYAPVLSINKHQEFVESGSRFLEDTARLLDQLGVAINKISTRREQVNKDGSRSHRLRLIISSQPDNLVRLWSQVGFEYNTRKRHLAGVAAQYLKLKQGVLRAREEAAQSAISMHEAGVPSARIYEELTGKYTQQGFLEHSLYRDPERKIRVGDQFITFDEYCRQATTDLGQSGTVWECIAAIEPVDGVDLVYDFTVEHPDHNFVANGFVVSNCGVRVLASNISHAEIEPHLPTLASVLYQNCPSGVGQGGNIKLSNEQLERLLRRGSEWALKEGYALPEDVERTEESGCLSAADPEKVSQRALKRGIGQVGTLGAGNHFIEVDIIEQVFDQQAADAMGLVPGNIAVQIHCGSRGFGHQVCSDYLRDFQSAFPGFGIDLPDRQLMCAPFKSPEGRDYYAAMCAAANYAFVNRQVLVYHIRRSFEEALAGKIRDWHLHQVYDIAHNMAKVEKHEVDGEMVEVVVHRKGATRAFGPGFEGLPEEYRPVGQPVLVPGSMGTSSWILVGTPSSMAETFGSTCHGAGRTMSRSQAKKMIWGETLREELEQEGINIRAGSMPGLAEEAPQAYKDVDEVVKTVSGAGIARKVARLVPVAVIKG
jgi:tRNA-splicing ligase RtcB